MTGDTWPAALRTSVGLPWWGSIVTRVLNMDWWGFLDTHCCNCPHPALFKEGMKKDYATCPEHFRRACSFPLNGHTFFESQFYKMSSLSLAKQQNEHWHLGVQGVIYWMLLMHPWSMLNVFSMYHLNFMFIITLWGEDCSPFTDEENWG